MILVKELSAPGCHIGKCEVTTVTRGRRLRLLEELSDKVDQCRPHGKNFEKRVLRRRRDEARYMDHEEGR